MKRQNIAIIGVVAFILAIAVGYALFSETITINGTATAKGDFDVEFTSVGEITKVGYTDMDATDADGSTEAEKKAATDARIASISADKNTLTVKVNKLDYPGAYVEIPVTITNKGSISAKLKEIKETGLTEANRAIKVTYTGIAASDVVINTNETQSMVIKVEWDENVNSSSENVEFKIELNYEQVQ